MSDFLIAHKEVMNNEGGVNFNPKDRGNVIVNGVVTLPTYKGIAPKFWPQWGGWRYISGCISQMVKMPAFGTSEYYSWAKYLNSQLEKIPALQRLVLDFYKTNFWKRLGEIENQAVATWVYDKDVNTGSMGSRWLQEALGVTVDGAVGSKTIAAANAADPVPLLEEMKKLARAYYRQIVASDPSQEQFLRGWLARV